MALDKAGGLRALKPGRRGRQPGSGRLTLKQAQRIRQLIVGKMPDQLKLPFYLWTRAAVAILIEREYGTTVSMTSVGRYLKAWGMKPAKAGAACLRAQRLGDCALVAPGVSGDRARSKTPGRHDLLG